MAQLKDAARTALDNVMQLADERYRDYCALSGNQYSPLMEKTQVLDYRALYDLAKGAYPGDLDAYIDRVTDASIAAGDDMRITSLRIVQAFERPVRHQNTDRGCVLRYALLSTQHAQA